MQLELSAEQVSVLMSLMPASAVGLDSGFSYADGYLTVPQDWAGSVEAIIAAPGWDDGSVRLSAVKADLKAAIDRAAEREREKYITPGAGQMLTYQRKAEEAQRLADRIEADAGYDPNPADYPLLAAEVGITAPALVGVGTVVLAALQQWLAIGGAIEAVRLASKAAIEAAADEAAARAVIPVWP